MTGEKPRSFVYEHPGPRILFRCENRICSGRYLGVCPLIQPLGIFAAQVDTAMASGRSPLVVPVSAMESVTGIKVHHVRHIREIVSWASHQLIVVFAFDTEFTLDGGGMSTTTADAGGKDEFSTLICPQGLRAEIDLNPLLV